MNDKFLLMIQAALDSKGIKSDYNKIKQMFDKDPAKINAVLDMSATKTEINKFIKEVAPQLQEMFSKKNINVDLKDIESAMKSVFKESEKAAKQYQKELEKMHFDELKGYAHNEKLKQDAIKQTAKIQQDALSLKTGKLNTASNIDTFLAINTKMTKELRAEFLKLKTSLDSVDDSKSLANINKDLGTLKNKAKETGQVGKSMGDNFKEAFGKFSVWVSASAIFFGVQRVIKDMVGEVKNIDSSMINLKKVTNEVDATYDRFLTNASQKAKELGISISDLVNATADFARLGYNLSDAAKLGEVASLYKNVGDGIDIGGATQSIISTMKAFNIETKDSITIIDKYNQVGNSFAISSAGIGESLMRSASALMEANNTLDESIALTVAANNVVQDPEKVGNMWKTVAMRIRGAKTELEEAGLETDGMVDSTSKLREEIKSLTGGFDIMLDDSTFKSTYDIVLGIANVYEKMTDTSQANLLEMLAGKRQGNALAAALNNVKDLQKALESSEQSFGSALAEQKKYEEGISYSLDRMKASMQELSLKTLDSSAIKFFVDLANGAVNATTAVGGLVPVLSTLLVLYLSFTKKEKFAFLQNFISYLFKTKLSVDATTVSIKGLTLSTKALTGLITGGLLIAIPLLIKGLDAAITTLEEQKEALEASNTAYEESKSKLKSINSELETTRERIDELEAKDNLTFVEDGELQKLQEITKELLIQQDIIDKQNQENAKALAETASDTFKKQFGNSVISENQINDYVNSADTTGNNAILISDTNDITSMIAGYKQFIELQDEALVSGASEDYEHFKGLTEDISNSLWDNVSVLQEQQSNMRDYYNMIKDTPYEQLTSEQKKVYDNYNLISDAIELIYQNLDPSKLKEMNFNEVFNSSTISKIKTELEEMARAGQLTPEVLSSNKEYQKLLQDTGLSAEECASQINAMVDVSSELGTTPVTALKSYKYIIDDVSKNVKLVTEAQYELSDSGYLNYDTVSDLLEVYPQLQDSLTLTESGYTLTKGALDNLIDSEIEQYQQEFDNAVSAASTVYGAELTKQQGYDGTAESIRRIIQAKIDLANAEATTAKNAYNSLGIGMGGLKDYKPYTDAIAYVNELKKSLDGVSNAETNLKNSEIITKQINIDTKKTLTDKNTKKSSSTPKWLTDYNTTKDDYNHQLAMDKITQEEYYDKLEKLSGDVYKNHKKDFLDTHRKNQEDIYKGRKQIDDNLIKSKFDANEHAYAMGEKTEEEYYKTLEWLNWKYYKKDKDNQDTYLSNREKLYAYDQKLLEEDNDAKLKDTEDYINTVVDRYKKSLSDIDKIASNSEDGSDEQLQSYSNGLKTASDQVQFLEAQVKKLNKQYKDKSDEDYIKQLENLTSKIDDAKESMLSYQESITDGIKEQLEKQTDALEDAYKEQEKAIEDRYDKELDMLNEIVDAKKKALQSDKDAAKYAKDLAEKTKALSDIDTRMADLSKAANSGDREAQAELKKLQEDRSKAQEALDELQADHKLDTELKALDEFSDNYEKQSKLNMQFDLDSAKSVHEQKLADITALYQKEQELIKNVADYTKSQFTTALQEINSQLTNLGVNNSASSNSLANSYDQLKNNSNSIASSAKNSAVLSLLSNGTSKTGNSELNKYVKSNYGSYLTFAEMVKLAQMLGLSKIDDVDDVQGNSANRMAILNKLKSARYAKGGIGEVVGSLGEHGIGLFRNKEALLSEFDSKNFKDFVPIMNDITKFIKLNIPDTSKLITKTTSPNINMPITIQGNADSSTVSGLNNASNNIVKQIMSEVRKL